MGTTWTPRRIHRSEELGWDGDADTAVCRAPCPLLKSDTMEDVWVILLSAAFVTFAGYAVCVTVYNVYFHPSAAFPGPPIARTTIYWKAYVECILKRSFCDVLNELHAHYGEKRAHTALRYEP